MLRDEWGKFVSKNDDYYVDQDDIWYKDHKEFNVRFPEHKGNQNGEVHIFNLKDIQK